MAQFSAEVFHNEFLDEGETDVNAIIRMKVSDTGRAGSDGAAGEIIIIDSSASMGQRAMMAARQAAMVALDHIYDGTYFAIVSGTHQAYLAYPLVQSGPGMVMMTPRTRAEAKAAISRLQSNGGTAIGAWLELTRNLFLSMGEQVTQRHALLLTDGANEHESPQAFERALTSCDGIFQCDCRGVGTRWKVEEVRAIASRLMGTVDIIPQATMLSREFAQIMTESMRRGVSKPI